MLPKMCFFPPERDQSRGWSWAGVVRELVLIVPPATFAGPDGHGRIRPRMFLKGHVLDIAFPLGLHLLGANCFPFLPTRQGQDSFRI